MRGLSFQSDGLASFTDSQLYRSTDDASLGRAFWLPFFDEESSLGAKSTAAFMTDKASVMPLASESGHDNLVEDRLFAAQTTRRGATGVAPETPCKPVILDKRGFLVERLLPCLLVSIFPSGT